MSEGKFQKYQKMNARRHKLFLFVSWLLEVSKVHSDF